MTEVPQEAWEAAHRAYVSRGNRQHGKFAAAINAAAPFIRAAALEEAAEVIANRITNVADVEEEAADEAYSDAMAVLYTLARKSRGTTEQEEGK
ncbi:hypothetical protein [Prauserella endophytica]|uniref:Uncharacterized protein n=1 Tax=Prauserella endophytica TaxID=1592324 RepID=A0ABY2S093_9PSEU|nr:hypothetical protein [Prauserella endophytica]TKG67045.1 hypothetical protein FCN18_24375 [Prauserella endophytica]